MKCRNVKEGTRGCKFVTQGFISMHYASPSPMLLKHLKTIMLPDHQVSSGNLLDLPLKHMPSSRVTLILLSTTKLFHEGWGLHVFHTKLPSPLRIKLEGRRHAGKPLKLRGAGTLRYKLEFRSSTAHKAAILCSVTLSRAKLALTLIKLVLKPIDVITKLKSGLEMFYGVYVVPLSSSKLK